MNRRLFIQRVCGGFAAAAAVLTVPFLGRPIIPIYEGQWMQPPDACIYIKRLYALLPGNREELRVTCVYGEKDKAQNTPDQLRLLIGRVEENGHNSLVEAVRERYPNAVIRRVLYES